MYETLFIDEKNKLFIKLMFCFCFVFISNFVLRTLIPLVETCLKCINFLTRVIVQVAMKVLSFSQVPN